MKKIKTYEQFTNKTNNELTNEVFTITLDQLPSIGDIVDKIDWKEGERTAFIDFKGIKNIPVNIASKSDKNADIENTLETA